MMSNRRGTRPFFDIPRATTHTVSNSYLIKSFLSQDMPSLLYFASTELHYRSFFYEANDYFSIRNKLFDDAVILLVTNVDLIAKAQVNSHDSQ